MSAKRPPKADPHHPLAKLAAIKVQTAPISGGPNAKKTGTQRPKPAPVREAVYEDDDRQAFAMLVEGVAPLNARPTAVDALGRGSLARRARLEDDTAITSAADEAVRAQLRSLVDAGTRFEVREDGKSVTGRRIDVPLETLGKLRRGGFSVPQSLDLHGLKPDQARLQLEGFLAREMALGERAVLVIHGKGRHSPQAQGVLRLEMAAWLSQGTASEFVAAFCTALPDEGGEGAVRVLLRPGAR